ncbi:MFS transporter [Allocoleopsis franciscana]|uniref:Arabinose efflux permease family protein n=1 Tax=Allocoleopsis franciscana PCC 7113 TaxID=1173027 RepID=K9WJJ9_9CYAN|nr:MFS transporter [Allocoleopsis franciscana]AFZ20560.1 arabinose efflux permease family protein [Allocoleopsis franciscana PCC 7113]
MFPAEPPARTSGFRALLKNRPFMVMWFGQLLSQVSDKVCFVLLISLLDYYQSPPALENSMRSALMVAFTLPAMFFGSAAGIFVDRVPKKQLLIGADVVRAVLMLLILLLPKQFVLLLVITFLLSSMAQFSAPAEQAAIPLLVRPENLMSANALFTTTMMGSLIVGFAIGEPVLYLVKNWAGENGQTVFVSISYLVAGLSSIFIKIQEKHINSNTLAIHPWHDFREGLRYLWKNRQVKNAMMQLTILYSVFAALTVLAFNLAERIGLKSTQFGFLLAAAGIGVVFGAGVLGHWGDRFHHKPLPLVGFLSMAFVLAVFTFTQYIWLGLGLSALLGLAASLIGVPMQTVIHTSTEETMRGKIFGFQNNVVNIALSLPLAIAGPLTDSLGLRTVLIGMSVVVAAAGIWAWHNTRNVLQDVI